ncbi:hypothetical protein M427DRAFT_130233 [Gonapodya prolifera JEL478]|uniref:Reelin domain-containing protein n=1 Tax=Gonapodya prolifera (strain JEL478) TaxID=1344416 RepID=A0A139B1H2_GONPJ|nr:hypothetical protein M427DRAFT_130233 [Gonapodya prolifera JEL478]|eukprot:KXS22585.1 hypothetical protein M427DRAFT_130233 [Gonapodya prolifera JEL478]
MWRGFFFALLLIFLATPDATAYPRGGMPICQYGDTESSQMAAVHGGGGPQLAELEVTPDGTSYRVSIIGIESYRGLLLWVRADGSKQHVGTFNMEGLSSMGLWGKDCSQMSGASSGQNSTLSHIMSNTKRKLSFTWRPDAAVVPGTNLLAEAIVVTTNKANWFTAKPGRFVVARREESTMTSTTSTSHVRNVSLIRISKKKGVNGGLSP